jgi:hypothetical protein
LKKTTKVGGFGALYQGFGVSVQVRPSWNSIVDLLQIWPMISLSFHLNRMPNMMPGASCVKLERPDQLCFVPLKGVGSNCGSNKHSTSTRPVAEIAFSM